MQKLQRLISGQIIIEVVVGLAIAAIALLVITQISTRSTANAGYASRQAAATGLASGALEKARNIKRTKGLAAKTDPVLSAGIHCFDGAQIADTTGDYCSITNTIYQGRVTFTPSGKEIKMVAEIRWDEAGGIKVTIHEGLLVFEI